MNNEEKSKTANLNEEKTAKLQKTYKGLIIAFSALALLWIALIAFMFVSGKGKPTVFIPVAIATLIPLLLSIKNSTDQAKK